jgi:hypothetical protein
MLRREGSPNELLVFGGVKLFMMVSLFQFKETEFPIWFSRCD